MGTPTPTMEQVLDAVYDVLAAMSPLPGIVLWHGLDREDEAEFLRRYRQTGTDEIDLVMIEGTSGADIEGPAFREDYEVYEIRVRYLSVQRENEDWSRIALAQAYRIVNALDNTASIFRIGGQIPLRSGERAVLQSHGFVTFGGQKIYESIIALSVEARRWT